MLKPTCRFRPVDEVFGDFSDAAGILVAVSGGPDSMALLRLVHDWAAARGRPPLTAVTVDHGLRATSSDEARQVGNWCGLLGISHRILTWEGPRPTTRIQELARQGRYRLLDTCALDLGCDVLMTAHHADDQAETVLFRLARGSGIAGLAAMSPTVRRGRLLHARPLLGWSKNDLVVVCADFGQPFITDPANSDPRFARTRMRRLARELAPHGVDAGGLCRLAGRARRADRALETLARRADANLRIESQHDRVSLDFAGLCREPDEIVLRVVAKAIAECGGGKAVRLERLERLVDDLLRAGRCGTRFSATLGGAILSGSCPGPLGVRKETARSNRDTPEAHGVP